MATFEFVLPELGEGMEAGDVVQVLVTVGESITEEQPVLELETDKAVVEVPAPVSGTVKAIHVQAGDKAAVGQLLLDGRNAGRHGSSGRGSSYSCPCRRATAAYLRRMARTGPPRIKRCQGPQSLLPTLPQCLQASRAAAASPPPSNRPSHRVLQYQQHRPYDSWHAKLA